MSKVRKQIAQVKKDRRDLTLQLYKMKTELDAVWKDRNQLISEGHGPNV